MSDNQAATVDVRKDRDEFIQKLEAGLGGCEWKKGKEEDAWFGFRGNKSASFKVFAYEDCAKWEFIAFFSQNKRKSDFKEELKNAEWQGTDDINWFDESRKQNACISKNSGEKKYEFVVGVSVKEGKTTSHDQADTNGYFCIKPVIDGRRQNTTLPFDEAITEFDKFFKNVEKNSGIAQIFDDFFGE